MANAMGVPAGYAGEHPRASRDNLPQMLAKTRRDGRPLDDDEAKWDDTCADEMKYTAYELHERACRVQDAWEKSVAEVQPPLEQQSPQERAKAWGKLLAKASDLEKETGLRGMPGFSRLSYFRHVPVLFLESHAAAIFQLCLQLYESTQAQCHLISLCPCTYGHRETHVLAREH